MHTFDGLVWAAVDNFTSRSFPVFLDHAEHFRAYREGVETDFCREQGGARKCSAYARIRKRSNYSKTEFGTGNDLLITTSAAGTTFAASFFLFSLH